MCVFSCVPLPREDRVSLCSPSKPGTYYTDQGGTEIPISFLSSEIKGVHNHAWALMCILYESSKYNLHAINL